MLRKLFIFCLITTSINLIAKDEYDNGFRLPKMPAPHVSEENFTKIFGDQVAKASGLKKQLLLAVGFDHTAKGSRR
jgi:hypothetical protein